MNTSHLITTRFTHCTNSVTLHLTETDCRIQSKLFRDPFTHINIYILTTETKTNTYKHIMITSQHGSHIVQVQSHYTSLRRTVESRTSSEKLRCGNLSIPVITPHLEKLPIQQVGHLPVDPFHLPLRQKSGNQRDSCRLLVQLNEEQVEWHSSSPADPGIQAVVPPL